MRETWIQETKLGYDLVFIAYTQTHTLVLHPWQTNMRAMLDLLKITNGSSGYIV